MSEHFKNFQGGFRKNVIDQYSVLKYSKNT